MDTKQRCDRGAILLQGASPYLVIISEHRGVLVLAVLEAYSCYFLSAIISNTNE